MKRIVVLGILSLWIQGYQVKASDIFAKNHLSPSSFVDENSVDDISFAPLVDQVQGFLDMNNHDQLSSQLSLMMVERLDESSTDHNLADFEQNLRQDLHNDFVSGDTDIDYSLNVPKTDFFDGATAIPPPDEYREGSAPPPDKFAETPLLWVYFNVDEEGGVHDKKDRYTYEGMDWYQDNSTPLFINENEVAQYPEQITISQGTPILIWDMDQQIYMEFTMKSAVLPAVKGNQFELLKDNGTGGKSYSIEAPAVIQETYIPIKENPGYLSLANMISMTQARKEGWITVLQGNSTPFLDFGKEIASRQLPFNYVIATKSVSHFTRLRNPVFGFDDDGHLLKDTLKSGNAVFEPPNYNLDSHTEGGRFRTMMEYEIYHLEYMADIFARNKKTSWNSEFAFLLKMYLEKAKEWKYFIDGFDFQRAVRDELINRYKSEPLPRFSSADLSNVLKTLFKISYGQDKLFSKYIKVEHVDPERNNYELIRTFKNKMMDLLNDLSFYESNQEVISLSENGEAREALNALLNKQVFIAGESGIKLKSSLTPEEKTQVRRFNQKVMEELYPDVLRIKHKNSMDSDTLNHLLKSLGLPEFSRNVLDPVKEKFFDMPISPSTTHGNFLEKTYLLIKGSKLTAFQVGDLFRDSDFLDILNQKLCFLRSLQRKDPTPDTEKSS